MSNLSYNMGKVVDLAKKNGSALIIAAVSTLYKSKVELASHFVHRFIYERFKIRLNDFVHEEKELNDEKNSKFYENISSDNINILFDLLEKARLSTYDLHAKILAKLYGKLLQNGKLDYYEHALLANINSLSDLDFIYFYDLIKNKPNSPLITDDDYEYIAINKFIQIGILSTTGITYFGSNNNEKVPINFQTNCFSEYLFEVLNLIMSSRDVK